MKLVTWGPTTPGALRATGGLPPAIGYGLIDDLTFGPHHPDLGVQRSLRIAYFREPALDDTPAVAAYAKAAAAGDELVLWCEPLLPNCIGMLWAVESLFSAGVSPGQVSYAMCPFHCAVDEVEREEQLRVLAGRRPVAEIAPLLVAVRRHLASDTEVVRVDLEGVPEDLRGWLGLTDRWIDFLPDSRGLDRLDRALLNALAPDWQKISRIVGSTFSRFERSIGSEVGFSRAACWSSAASLTIPGKGLQTCATRAPNFSSTQKYA